MGLLVFVSRLILIIVNIIFFLLSLSLIVLGLILRFGGDAIKDRLDDVLKQLNTSVKGVFSTTTDLNTNQLDMGHVFLTVAVMAIVLGLVFLGLSFFGLFGACYKNKCMLITYVTIVSILVTAQIVIILIVVIHADTLKDPIEKSLQGTLDHYQGTNGTDAYSLTWNVIMVKLDCCGVKDYSDFRSHKNWWGVNSHVHPFACCSTLPTTTTERDNCAGATSSTAVSALKGSNYDKGCMDAVWNLVVHHALSMTIAFVSVAAQILLVIFGIILIVQANKEKVKPSESDEWTPRRPRRRRDSGW